MNLSVNWGEMERGEAGRGGRGGGEGCGGGGGGGREAAAGGGNSLGQGVPSLARARGWGGQARTWSRNLSHSGRPLGGVIWFGPYFCSRCSASATVRPLDSLGSLASTWVPHLVPSSSRDIRCSSALPGSVAASRCQPAGWRAGPRAGPKRAGGQRTCTRDFPPWRPAAAPGHVAPREPVLQLSPRPAGQGAREIVRSQRACIQAQRGAPQAPGRP